MTLRNRLMIFLFIVVMTLVIIVELQNTAMGDFLFFLIVAFVVTPVSFALSLSRAHTTYVTQRTLSAMDRTDA